MTPPTMAGAVAGQPPGQARPATTRDACRRALLELARVDQRVICVDADMGGLDDVFAERPGQYVNVGIAEANLMSLSAGLATTGFRPFAHTICSFAVARACEQIKIDIASAGLPVCVVVTHSGLSAGHYGPTHHSVNDLAIIRTMPNMTVLVPADVAEAEWAVRAAHQLPGPAFIRLGRDATPAVHDGPCAPQVGQALTLREGDDVAIVATGPHPVLMALAAATSLGVLGVGARVLGMHTVKPIDEAALVQAAEQTRGIVTVEDHLVVGGLGGAVAEVVAQHRPCRVHRIGVPDEFIDRVGDERYLLAEAGVGADQIVAAALSLVRATAAAR
ncbi:MAG TPA: transketolase C-terminal domain-containing protein [Streptosporangiaceae bacterium]|nr:transketolase C-terminal domain-containing protein [Streptosporangiaceae bacterium]